MEFSQNDRNDLFYREFIASFVPADKIINIFVPKGTEVDVEGVTYVDVLDSLGGEAIYDIPGRLVSVTNFDITNLMEVVSKYGNETKFVDFNTAKLMGYDNSKGEIEYNAQIVSNGVKVNLYTDFIVKGKLDKVEDKLEAYYLNFLKYTDELVTQYIKDNQSEFFVKNGNFRADAVKRIRKLMDRLGAEVDYSNYVSDR